MEDTTGVKEDERKKGKKKLTGTAVKKVYKRVERREMNKSRLKFSSGELPQISRGEFKLLSDSYLLLSLLIIMTVIMWLVMVNRRE